ncbi:hypothetical protein [Polynucleobacter necessarius]|uniref:hypothetical protein n=1 Tax=Polynucleobacter necessarius TaxID=576610 RepID=UPI000E09053F|nr:hypothetical protein [Polynucleobacter necessarius]
MKQEFTDIKTKLKEFYPPYMAIAKVYAQKWIAIVIKAQNDLYVLTHEWFSTHLPRVAQQYDKAPPWTQKGLFLPSLVLPISNHPELLQCF